MLLSIAMIVKNEENNLDRCLNAIKSLEKRISYEIIIVDTGSEDKTIEIARKYTDNIFQKQWNDNFAEIRNYSISKCKGEWILILDADEVLENPDELVEFLKNKINKKINSAAIKFKNIISSREDSYILGSIVRLFKNKKEFYYTGKIHEQPQLLKPIIATNITVVHYGYSKDSFKLMNYKYERNLKLLLEEVKENKEDPYTYFQLAQTYYMANMNIKAIESISKAYFLIQKKENKKNFMYVYHQLAMCLLSASEYEKVIKICKEAIKLNKEHLDFYYFMAISLSSLNNYNEAIEYYNAYFKLLQKIKDGYIVSDISVNSISFSMENEVFKDRLILAFKNKDYNFIVNNYRGYNKEDVKDLIIYSFIINKEYDKLINYLNKYKKEELDDDIINIIILSCEKIAIESMNDNALNIFENLYGLSEKIDIYINYIYKDENINLNNINLNKYYEFYSKIVSKFIINKNSNFNKLLDLEKETLKLYLVDLFKDFKGIESAIEYSRGNFLEMDYKKLTLLTSIEDLLIKSKNIESSEYSSLLYRCLINKINYINIIYNKDILNSELFNILPRKDKFYIKLVNIIKIYSINKYNYIKELKGIIKEYPEYILLLNYLRNEIMDEKSIFIDNELLKSEKNILIKNITILLENNKLDESEAVINEVINFFKYDYEVNNLIGIISYLKGDYDKALINFSMSNLINENFDSMYNLALILEELNKNKLSLEYYKLSINLCNDNYIKEEILKKIYKKSF